jgi:hypothetical protein
MTANHFCLYQIHQRHKYLIEQHNDQTPPPHHEQENTSYNVNPGFEQPKENISFLPSSTYMSNSSVGLEIASTEKIATCRVVSQTCKIVQ